MSVRKGEPWGWRSESPADSVVVGDDRALAAAVEERVGSRRVGWEPVAGADFARAVGATGAARAPGTEGMDLPCDALRVTARGEEHLAVNMVVAGTPPDRQHRFTRSAHLRVVVDGNEVHAGPATAVVVANGQFLRGADVVPRGHPGDGRAEVQVYAVRGSQRASMRARLGGGEHVPHPDIRQVTGRRIELETARRWPLEVDGAAAAPALRVLVEVRPAEFVLVT